MYAVDRKYFIDLSVAYIDAPQKLGFGATISAPHMVFVSIIFILYIILYWLNRFKYFILIFFWKMI